MGILVTRPEDAGQHLTEMLNKAGVAAIYAPFIKIEAGEQLNDVPQKLQQLAASDYVISVSQYAVQYAHQVLQNTGFGWRKDVHYFAVGRKTAALLSEATQQPAHYPFANENSEGLLALPQMQNCNGRRVIILRGQSGRELLPQQLPQRGAAVETVACYCRQAQQLSEAELKFFSRAGIDTIVVTSGEILRYLLDFIPKSEHNWLMSCKLVVISDRLMQLALEAGWQQDKIILTEKADNLSLLKTILSFYPHS